jgi:hypothetical protein
VVGGLFVAMENAVDRKADMPKKEEEARQKYYNMQSGDIDKNGWHMI